MRQCTVANRVWRGTQRKVCKPETWSVLSVPPAWGHMLLKSSTTSGEAWAQITESLIKVMKVNRPKVVGQVRQTLEKETCLEKISRGFCSLIHVSYLLTKWLHCNSSSKNCRRTLWEENEHQELMVVSSIRLLNHEFVVGPALWLWEQGEGMKPRFSQSGYPSHSALWLA